MRAAGPSLVYTPVGHCIYCGSTASPLSDEHVIPFALGGNWTLPKSSCRACATITGKFEQSCLRGYLGQLRQRLDFPTRRKKERRIPDQPYPHALFAMEFEKPGYVTGAAPTTFAPKPILIVHGSEVQYFLSKEWALGTYRKSDFARMIAKIAHSYVWANRRQIFSEGWAALLPPLIRGEDTDLDRLVGGQLAPIQRKPDGRQLFHFVETRNGGWEDRELLVAQIQLFAFMGAPIYSAIVAERQV